MRTQEKHSPQESAYPMVLWPQTVETISSSSLPCSLKHKNSTWTESGKQINWLGKGCMVMTKEVSHFTGLSSSWGFFGSVKVTSIYPLTWVKNLGFIPIPFFNTPFSFCQDINFTSWRLCESFPFLYCQHLGPSHSYLSNRQLPQIPH